VDHQQKNWPEWLVLTEFVINNKTHSTTKVSLFIVNYRRELRMKVDLKRKEKIEKVIEFAERMKRVQDEAEAALKRAQEGINRQEGRKRKKVEI